MSDIIIREITKADNIAIAQVIRSVLIEFGVPKVGTAYEDEALDMMYETYTLNSANYFVVVFNGNIIGGAGIAPLEGYDSTVCELQKMYFLPIARGKGIGSKMMKICLKKALELNYKKCYLETMPYMESARKLYQKSGFIDLNAPMGNTGHYSCSKWMIKEL